IIVDVAVAKNIDLDLAVLKNHGTIASYADDGGAKLELSVRQSMMLNVRYQFLVLYTVGQEALAAGAEDVNAAVRDGALPVGEEHGLPLLRFPLAETGAAQQAVEDGAVGKVIVDVSA
ncbi:NADPH:quinone reductase, partial [Actinoplanes sp. NPDC051633]